MAKAQFGVLGLAVMGQNLAMNVANKGFTVAVFNRHRNRTDEMMAGPAKGNKKVIPTYSEKELCEALETPRRILIMVKAGAPVDEVIGQLKPFLQKGDMIIDGGNSYFKDTERRVKALEAEGYAYIGSGVSGGEEGALKGPCIMPGGTKKAYEAVEAILTKIAAQTEDGPCCAYIGPRGAGHYVKMIHNGIEYGIMQLTAETYDVMKRALGMTPAEMHEVFKEWNDAELGGYLMEITRDVLAKKDDITGTALVELIVDTAQQKGTGKWTTQEALDEGIMIPTITSAVEARIMSGFKDERVEAEKAIKLRQKVFKGDRAKAIGWLKSSLYASMICSYAQGMAMMKRGSDEYDYKLNLAEIARIWKGGCIIRSKLLDPIKDAYKRKKRLPNILVANPFKRIVKKSSNDWRKAVKLGIDFGIPMPATMGSLAYFDGYRTGRLPANLTQAQRDYFGAHTYQRTDREGTFHTEWAK
jgi:6-phosphogluconate dehydrogenase